MHRKKLTHSFSKEIHAKLADYEYELIELSEAEIKPFFDKKNFEAINVTIPYKETVVPYLDSVSEVAKRIGAVNTIVNKDGKLYGYNTDYYGIKALIERNGKLFFIDASLERLQATDDRPLSDTYEKLVKLYTERLGLYQSTADVIVPDMATPEAEAEYILTKRMELIK